MAKMKKLECEDCGFLCRSHNEKELADVGMTHMRHSHPDMKIAANDMKAKIQDA